MLQRSCRTVLVSCLLLSAGAVHAQDHRVLAHVFSVEDALGLVASGQNARRAIQAAFLPDQIRNGVSYAGNRARYTDADRRRLLDGLEEIAIRGHIPADARAAQREGQAIGILMMLATDPVAPGPEVSTIPQRLMRIHQQSESSFARSYALHALGDVLRTSPAQAEVIRRFLMNVATGSGDLSPMYAVEGLQNACAAGVNALRQLHEEGRTQDHQVIVTLRDLARRGFPLERRGPGVPCPQ
jgi:hypothetical protein